jgi:hypothetical protein
MLAWLDRRREMDHEIEALAQELVRTQGSWAYTEARILQRQAASAAEKRKWRAIAWAVSRMTKANRASIWPRHMAMGADFSGG